MAPLGRTIPLPTPKAAPRLPLPGRPEGGPLSQAAARQTAPISRPPVSRGTDVQSTNGYDTQRADAYKRTPAYHHAVKQVFKAQPTRQKVAILQGLARHQGGPTPEGLAVKDAVLELPLRQRAVLANYLKANPTPSFGSAISGALQHALQGEGVGVTGERTDAAGKSGPGGATILGSMFGGAKGVQMVVKNAANDAINLPGNTVQGLYKVGTDVGHMRFGNAFHDLADPFVNLAKDPAGAFYHHPVNTAMLFGGPETLVGRGAGAVARSGAFGAAAKAFAGTAREPLALGRIGEHGAPMIEERSYSPNVITKAGQLAWENHLRKRGIDPHVARPAPRGLHPSIAQALNVGVEAKLRRNVDEMTAVRQMSGRERRTRAVHGLSKLAPAKEVRNIVPNIIQGVIRSPKTAVADITKEIDRLKAAQTGSRTPKTIAARNQIRDLELALQHPELHGQAFDAAAHIRQLLHNADKVLVAKGLLDPEQAARSKLFPYAMAHMAAKYDPKAGVLTHHDGSPLPTTEILQHLKDNGVPDPAYVGHYPSKGEFWQLYQRYHLARGTADKQARTGEAFRTGNWDHTFPALVAQAGRTAETVTKAQLHDQVVNHFGILKPVTTMKNGRLVQTGSRPFRNTEEAARYAHVASHDDHGNPLPGRLDLVPISLAPRSSLDLVSGVQRPHELAHEPNLELRAFQQAMDEAKRPGTNNIALIPKIVADRFQEQFKTTGSRSLGKVTQQFRRTVLPYSTHWMMQIGAEAGLRGMVAGVLDPRNVIAGHQLMRTLTKTEEGRAALQEMVNATFYGSHKNLAIHSGSQSAPVALAKTLPVSRHIIAAHNRYADGVGATMYQLEHQFRLMGLGKLARRQLQEFTGSYQAGIRLQADNLAMLATKLQTNPALVSKFGRQIDDIFGKYNKMSPRARAMVQTATPFLPWYLNAAKFVLWQLPVKHPVASSLMASLRQTINQDIQDGKQLPLSKFAEEEIARITPFGIFNPPEHPGAWGTAAQAATTASSTILPQVLSPFYNLAGVNGFGDAALKGPNGPVKAKSPEATKTALESFIETVLPGASKVREALEGGRPSYGTSTLWAAQPKPGGGTASAGGVLNRLFNPFYSFERAAKSGGTAVAGSSGSPLGGSPLGGSSGGGGGGSPLG